VSTEAGQDHAACFAATAATTTDSDQMKKEETTPLTLTA
jgi:hypothetical protein